SAALVRPYQDRLAVGIERHVFFATAPGDATLCEQQHPIPGISKSSGQGPDRVDRGMTSNQRHDGSLITAFAARIIGPGVIGFHTENPVADLIIAADGCA